LSGELTVALKKGIRKKAKKALREKSAIERLRKKAKNGEEVKQLDEVVEHLEEVAELERKLGSFVIFNKADVLTLEDITKLAKQVKESSGIHNFDIIPVSRDNREYVSLFNAWQKGGGYGFFKPRRGAHSRYKIELDGPKVYLFKGTTIGNYNTSIKVEFTKYTVQHELFHVEMFAYIKNKSKIHKEIFNKIPTYIHEEYVLHRLMKTNKNWKKIDLESDLKFVNKWRNELSLAPISLKYLKNWKFEEKLKEIGFKI